MTRTLLTALVVRCDEPLSREQDRKDCRVLFVYLIETEGFIGAKAASTNQPKEKAMPQKTPATVTGFDGGSTLYDFFDADTGESVLVAHTYSEARFVLGDDFATTTRSLAVGHYTEMPAEAFTNRIPNV